ncbi:MAG: YceD family protein [Burkholderiales bacterium]
MLEQVAVDSLAFARGAQALRGKIAVADLPRLHDYLYSTAGSLEYELQGAVNSHGKPQLHLAVQGSISLKCQRCMKELAWSVNQIRDLLLIESAGDFPEIGQEDPAVDCIPAQSKLDVLALLEEEIILGLPLSPRHDTAACRINEEYAGSSSGKTAFAALAALKNSTRK